MAIDIKLPDVGDEDIEDVTINRWLVSEGDEVSEGDVLLEVATDKVDTEVAATASGTILKLNFGEGELVEIDAVLGQIGEAGEETNGASGGDSQAAGEAEDDSSSDREAQAAEQSGKWEASQAEASAGAGDASGSSSAPSDDASSNGSSSKDSSSDSGSASGGASGETIEVRLPQDDEIEDVTINRWLVSEGDKVSVGDVLLEVATDKVDTEIPSPAEGTVLKLNYGEGELVDITAVVAILGPEGASVGESGGGGEPESQTKSSGGASDDQEAAEQSGKWEAPQTQTEQEMANKAETNGADVKASPVARRVAEDRGVSLGQINGTGPGGQITKDDVVAFAEGGGHASGNGGQSGSGEALPGDLADVAPLAVTRLAAEYNIDLDEIARDRPFSALTKYDVLSAIATREAGEPVTVERSFEIPERQPTQQVAPAQEEQSQEQQAQPEAKAQPSQSRPKQDKAPAKQPAKSAASDTGDAELVKPTRMRQIIARNTFESLQSSPQLTTWHDVDMTSVIQHRKASKKEFASQGVNLTVTAYLIAATVEGLKAVPAANGKWTDDGIRIPRTYNVGMAASLPADEHGLGGLIVPVIHNAGDLNLMGIARQVNELAEKARSNKLTGRDLQGGTFTLTNYGTSGSVFQTPIIHEGQAGILGTGATEKRAVVVSNGHPLEANMGDYLAFKPMMTLAFTFDHRVLDGGTADAFCVAVKQALEGWS